MGSNEISPLPRTVDDGALGYGLLSSLIARGLGIVHILPAAGERPASPPHSRRPPTAWCLVGRKADLPLIAMPSRPLMSPAGRR